MKNLWRFLGWVAVCHALALSFGLFLVIIVESNQVPDSTPNSVVNGCACPEPTVRRQCSE
jgi:hypothetical protein